MVLSKDLVRHDITWNYIDALKVFENATIETLLPDPRSDLNGIDLYNWVTNAALSDENFTMKGPVIVDSILGYGDAEVHGTVNGKYITKEHILTSNDEQVIRGNVKLVTRNNHSILSNTINTLNVENINDINIDEFFENLVTVDDMNSSLKIDGSLVFKNPISVENLLCKIDAEAVGEIWENSLDTEESDKVNYLLQNMDFIEQQLEFDEKEEREET